MVTLLPRLDVIQSKPANLFILEGEHVLYKVEPMCLK
jgi:hypothetical protein